MTPAVFIDPAVRPCQAGDCLTLTGSEAHHAAAVRRIQVGETIDLTDGCGLRVRGQVTAVAKNPASLTLQVDTCTQEPAPRPRLILVQALAKAGRDEAAIEMAVEVGADEIIPWQAARSIVTWPAAKAEKKRQRWADIVMAAAKQSRRAYLPTVQPLHTTKQLSATLADAHILVLHEQASVPMTSAQLSAPALAVVVGPEGGITQAEVDLFGEHAAQAVTVGPYVMRSSTAGPIALAHLAERCGRWSV